MRVLVMSTPVSSHVLPLVPLLWAFRAAGHEVLAAVQPDVLGSIRSAGLTATTIGPPAYLEDMLLDGLDGRRPIEVRPRPAPDTLGGYGRVWTTHTKYLVADYLAFAQEFRPDLVVADPLDYSSLIVGGVLGVPVVHHRWSVDPISGVARRASRPSLRRLCQRYGLDELPEPTVLLDPCPPALQMPDIEPGTPIRYVPFNGNGLVPSWLREPRRGSRRVVMSTGSQTLLLNGISHMRTVLTALARIGDLEIVATVEERYRDGLGPLPDAVRVVDPAPLHLFFDSCDAVVHHGGVGTTMTSTAFGLPQLVLPQLADQFAMGDRLADLGAGITFDKAAEQDDPQNLQDALSALLGEPAYRKAAEELAVQMAGMPPPSQVAEDLAKLAGS